MTPCGLASGYRRAG